MKDNGKLYWYGASGEVLAETDLTGTTLDEYVLFNSSRVARRRQSDGAVFYFFSDHLGSARVVTNASGSIVEDSDFYPFGGERVVVDSLDNNYKFTGKERDTESGLDYFGARYHASTLGRFVTPDPFLPSAKVDDPQSWNRYAYARNNPLRYIDPDGLLWADLSEEQQRVFETYADLYNQQHNNQLTPEEVYATLGESQMATFEAVTHALDNTPITDANGNVTGNALQLVAGVTDIRGEILGARGDQQFRLFGNLREDVLEVLSSSTGFGGVGRNLFGFHPGYPISIRQRGSPPGIQFSISEDGLRGDIDIDYRRRPLLGIFDREGHLRPSNSDVMSTQGGISNYQRHIDRWPGLRNWWQ